MVISAVVVVDIAELGATRDVMEAGKVLEDMKEADKELVAAGVEGAGVGAGGMIASA